MSLLLKFFSFLLVLGFAGLFVMKNPDGQPWLSADDFLPDISLSNIFPKNLFASDIGASDSAVSVYRWRNAQGQWEFSDIPPEDLEAERMTLSTNANRDLYTSAKEKPAEEKSPKGPSVADRLSPTTVSPAKIATLVSDAEGVQKLLNDRKQTMDETLSR